jgi:hypothetical protein
LARTAFALSLLLTGFASVALAQGGETIVGTWKLVSPLETTAEGAIVQNPFGLHPTGFLTYTEDGRVMAIITYDGRKSLSVNDRTAAPAEEPAEAFATAFAYAGRYTFTGAKVTHQVEASTAQNWVNTDLVRVVKLEGNRQVLSTASGVTMGGVKIRSTELVWERWEAKKPLG